MRRAATVLVALCAAGATHDAGAESAVEAYRAANLRDVVLAADTGALHADSSATTPHRRLWLAPTTRDDMLGFDKLLHASVSYGAFLTFRLAEDSSTDAALSAFAVGLAKEAHDVWLRAPGPTQGASWRDLIADAAGVAAGALAWKLLAP